MRRPADALLGVVLMAAFAAALPLGLRLAGDTHDLSVVAPTAEPYEVVQPGAPLAAVQVRPRRLLPRLERNGLPERSDPGLWLRTWQVTYGHRWERQVTLPALAGPFDVEGKPWPCAVAVRFSPRFFDDGTPGGEDVESVVDRVVRAQFPFEVMGLRFAAVSSTKLHVRPVEGGLEVSGNITLSDSARSPTEFRVKAKIAVGERDGDLAAKISRVNVVWRGRTRDDPLVDLASLLLDVDDRARAVVSAKLGGALSILKLPKEPIALFAGRPKDRFLIRLCDAPESHEDGLTVRLRLVASLAEPRVEPAVPGPPHLEERPVLAPAAGEQPSFEASVSAAGVQQALYAMWQAGELAAWGKQERVVSAMQKKLDDRLAFEVGTVVPRLPPVVVPEGAPGALKVRFGGLEVGRRDNRRVVAHGDMLATARVEDGAVGLMGTLADLRVNCVEGAAGDFRLSPCFSDVVPALRESELDSEGLPLSLPVPDRLLRINLVLGTDLVLHGLAGEVGGSPPQLRLRGEAKLVRRAGQGLP